MKGKPKRKKRSTAQVQNDDVLATPDDTSGTRDQEFDEGCASDGEDRLHGPCGEPTFGQDSLPGRFRKLVGELVTLEFDVDDQEDLVLYTVVVEIYNQSTDNFAVRFYLVALPVYLITRHVQVFCLSLFVWCFFQVRFNDDGVLEYNRKDVLSMAATFDLWYGRVSNQGRNMRRKSSATRA